MSASLYSGFRRGILNLPGLTSSSKEITRSLLSKDASLHHCYFNNMGFHNHLSHHLLAAYDLGASAGLLQKKYEEEASYQRPIYMSDKDKTIHVSKENWVQYLGNQSAYGSFVTFFEDVVSKEGVEKTLENYIFGSEANETGRDMNVRLVSGALHPFIQIGYGLEFGLDALVATGLAQTAIHKTTIPAEFYPLNSESPGQYNSVWSIYREVCDSKTLTPVMPYDPEALLSKRLQDALSDGRPEEINRLIAHLSFENGEKDVQKYADEIVWLAVCLCFGTSKANRKPRLDFFLMHIVTSSIFFPAYLKTLQNTKIEYRINLARSYLTTIMMLSILRGRPRIDPAVLMSYTDVPRPPSNAYKIDNSASGSPEKDEHYNPWPALIDGVLYAPDSHTIKTMRTLVYAASQFGEASKGVVGEKDLENGEQLDGTIFVRAAGVLQDYMGWATYGQMARDNWDRSGLGWDEAWQNDD